MAKGQSGRRKIVPESHQAIDQLKYEIAAEMGLPLDYQQNSQQNAIHAEFSSELGAVSHAQHASQQKEAYWGHISSRDAGAVGGAITSRLIQKAEQSLLSL